MRVQPIIAALLLGACAAILLPVAQAGVVVLANRSGQEVQFTLTGDQGPARTLRLAAGGQATIPMARSLAIAFAAGTARRHYQLNANSMYYFADLPAGLDLQQIGLNEPKDQPAAARELAPNLPRRLSSPEDLTKISVKLLVDQKEPAARLAWEARLRRRIEAASAVLKQHCRVQLEVVAVGTWESDDAAFDLSELLRDFEAKVRPHPARLAIGYTSRRSEDPTISAPGTCCAPLHTHILLREWEPRSETGRLEGLLHELGHYLGAAHSPEHSSTMRPPVAAGVRGVHAPFDPLSTLAMNLVAEEIRTRGARRLEELSPAAKQRLGAIYGVISQTLPGDPAAEACLRRLGAEPPPPTPIQAPVGGVSLGQVDYLWLHPLIKPGLGEAQWARVPWMPSTDIWAARQRAAAEGKPLFLWYMAGEPLGTC